MEKEKNIEKPNNEWRTSYLNREFKEKVNQFKKAVGVDPVEAGFRISLVSLIKYLKESKNDSLADYLIEMLGVSSTNDEVPKMKNLGIDKLLENEYESMGIDIESIRIFVIGDGAEKIAEKAKKIKNWQSIPPIGKIIWLEENVKEEIKNGGIAGILAVSKSKEKIYAQVMYPIEYGIDFEVIGSVGGGFRIDKKTGNFIIYESTFDEKYKKIKPQPEEMQKLAVLIKQLSEGRIEYFDAFYGVSNYYSLRIMTGYIHPHPPNQIQ